MSEEPDYALQAKGWTPSSSLFDSRVSLETRQTVQTRAALSLCYYVRYLQLRHG